MQILRKIKEKIFKPKKTVTRFLFPNRKITKEYCEKVGGEIKGHKCIINVKKENSTEEYVYGIKECDTDERTI